MTWSDGAKLQQLSREKSNRFSKKMTYDFEPERLFIRHTYDEWIDILG